jgi:GNAT superfamily N-acetyltransferase
MKGLRLFVRPIEAADSDAVAAFLEHHGSSAGTPQLGLIGKLIGDLVAVLAMRVTAEALLIDHIVVARNLRRKRIGRVMLDEAEQIAVRMDRPLLVIEDENASAGFLQRVGFEREGPRWIRKVKQ